nr:MFS transporter [Gordonia paraffinivorans]
MFADPTVPGAGLSGAQISALFALWSASTVVVEVPTGVLADRFSRRWPMVLGPCVTGTGFALWVFVPSFASFAAGFVLWAIGGALRSGTAQALVYDELDAEGRAGDYARFAGAMRAASAVGVIAGTALAAPLFEWGGYTAAGVAGIVSCVLCALASAALPESRRRRSEPDGRGPEESAEYGDPDPDPGVRAVIGSGVRSLRGRPVARRLLLLVVVLTWVGALDEYLPLLVGSFVTGTAGAASAGGDEGVAAPQTVALLMVVVSVGDICGALAAGRFRRPAAIGPAVALAAAILVVVSLWGHPAGVVGVAVAFGVFGWALVVAEAALQDRLDSESRATVTSLAGMGEELVALLAFAAWAAGSVRFDPPVLFALAAVPYLLVPYLASAGAMTVSASRRWRKRMSRKAPM